MIQFTTGIALLVSSVLSNPGIIQATTTPINASTTQTASITTTSTASSTTPAQDDSIQNVKAYVQTTYANEPILIDIARCESQFRQYDKDGSVIHGKVNAGDVGVMQINEKYHLEKAESMGFNLETTAGNVAYAAYLYQTQGAAPWSASEKCWDKSLAQGNANQDLATNQQ